MNRISGLALATALALATSLARSAAGQDAASDAIRASLARPQQLFDNAEFSLSRSVYDFYFKQVVQRDLAAEETWMSLKTPTEIAAHQRELRQRMIAAVGGLPERTSLNVKVTGRIPRDGYVIEKLLFESLPGFYVTAHLFLPDDAKFAKPYPGLITPQGHSRGGKCAPWFQRPSVLGAKSGFATLVYDPIDQGERHQMRPFTNLSWSASSEHYRCGIRAMMLGWNVARFRIHDALRAIDVLCERPDVDGSKIGVLGVSGGGTLTSYVMALDDRVKAACPAAYLTSLRLSCDRCGPQDAEQNIYGQLAFGLNHLGYVLMRAPSPVLVNCSQTDFFPFHGTLETASLARRFYAARGAADRFGVFDVPGPHHWYESELWASLAWMRRWLCDEKDAWPADPATWRRLDASFSYAQSDIATASLEKPHAHIPPTGAGAVTPRGYVLDLPGARSVYDILRDELGQAHTHREGLTPERVRQVAGMRGREELSALPCDVRRREIGGVRICEATLVTPENLRLPTVSFVPRETRGRPLLIVSDAARTAQVARVKAALSAGRPVMVAELRAFGETGVLREEKRKNGVFGCFDEDEEVAVLCAWLGESLVAHRAEDLVRVAAAFSEQLGGMRPEILAEGRAAIPAAHAFYAYRDLFAGIAVSAAPDGWGTVLENPDRPYRFANVVHGALKTYDWTELVK